MSEDTTTPEVNETSEGGSELAPLTGLQLLALMSNLNPERVSERQQGNSTRTLSYLEAWDVKASLIRVFGFGGFSAEVIETSILYRDQVAARGGNAQNWKIAAQATVRLTIPALGCVYTETAVGGSTQPDVTEALDMALKTAESDALKRCAIYLGTQFGLSLYASTGSKAELRDVVRTVFEPEQRRILEVAAAEREAAIQAEKEKEKVDA